jgi:hypothetical protein
MVAGLLFYTCKYKLQQPFGNYSFTSLNRFLNEGIKSLVVLPVAGNTEMLILSGIAQQVPPPKDPLYEKTFGISY